MLPFSGWQIKKEPSIPLVSFFFPRMFVIMETEKGRRGAGAGFPLLKGQRWWNVLPLLKVPGSHQEPHENGGRKRCNNVTNRDF